ncbi:hypothetical protein ACMXYQ_08930 [Neptuniibacter sp. PT34_22]|uniref:hypothetical protein n=1 Tax=Neptuniibacter sp. PT34_22 TaxID=3398205 RepID=UPI0039F461D9
MSTIDKVKYPERYDLLKKELELRQEEIDVLVENNKKNHPIFQIPQETSVSREGRWLIRFICIAISGTYLYKIFQAISTSTIRERYAIIYESDSPMYFWLFIAMDALIAILFIWLLSKFKQKT